MLGHQVSCDCQTRRGQHVNMPRWPNLPSQVIFVGCKNLSSLGDMPHLRGWTSQFCPRVSSTSRLRGGTSALSSSMSGGGRNRTGFRLKRTWRRVNYSAFGLEFGLMFTMAPVLGRAPPRGAVAKRTARQRRQTVPSTTNKRVYGPGEDGAASAARRSRREVEAECCYPASSWAAGMRASRRVRACVLCVCVFSR